MKPNRLPHSSLTPQPKEFQSTYTVKSGIANGVTDASNTFTPLKVGQGLINPSSAIQSPAQPLSYHHASTQKSRVLFQINEDEIQDEQEDEKKKMHEMQQNYEFKLMKLTKEDLRQRRMKGFRSKTNADKIKKNQIGVSSADMSTMYIMREKAESMHESYKRFVGNFKFERDHNDQFKNNEARMKEFDNYQLCLARQRGHNLNLSF